LDDGSGIPIKVIDLMYDGMMEFPNAGEYWTATGVIVRESDGAGGYRPVLSPTAPGKSTRLRTWKENGSAPEEESSGALYIWQQ
jgi:hypothetical protein